MKRVLLNKFLLAIISIIIAGTLASCGLNNLGGVSTSRATYKYDNRSVMDEVTIAKSVYSTGKLIIYISDLGENPSVECYDANFKYLDNDFDYDYKNGKLTIKGEGAEEISGLRINSSSNQVIRLRYLDSNQYAILIDHFVDDLGTETYGDWNAYYTEEERAAQQAAKDEKIRKQEENYKAVEGYWESVEDNGEYVYIYTDEKGDKRLRQALNYNEELNIKDTYICTINIAEIGIPDYYAYYELKILDSEGWGCQYLFDLNEDMTAIMDWNTKEARFLRVEGMTPDLTVN